ncbi:DUF359 domain-containing protein [Patescibacteria group bacterium]|nr:DUF359 domain-containing protein [Patescibacteria group bacterium]
MYKTIALAGTFDRLHKGHRFFIRQAFYQSRNVLIGLASDEYVQGKLKTQMSHLACGRANINLFDKLRVDTDGSRSIKTQTFSFKERKRELENFLREEKLLDRVEIVKIDDMYGPAIDVNSRIEALAITPETSRGGKEVNRRRRRLGLDALPLITISLVLSEDTKRISSTRIRNGEIDRMGRIYRKVLTFNGKIPEALRMELKEPQGRLINGDLKNLQEAIHKVKGLMKSMFYEMVITVGDEVTSQCNKAKIEADLAIVDYHINRKRKFRFIHELGFEKDNLNRINILSARNPAGCITTSSIKAVNNSIKSFIETGNRQIITIVGEEDLVAVPAILLAPLDAIVLYGQPGKGIIVVQVTEEKKKEMKLLIEKYK